MAAAAEDLRKAGIGLNDAVSHALKGMEETAFVRTVSASEPTIHVRIEIHPAMNRARSSPSRPKRSVPPRTLRRPRSATRRRTAPSRTRSPTCSRTPPTMCNTEGTLTAKRDGGGARLAWPRSERAKRRVWRRGGSRSTRTQSEWRRGFFIQCRKRVPEDGAQEC